MQSGYTKKAEEVLRLATETAFELGHGNVGSEHILIGMLRTEDCLANTVLTENDVDIDKVIEIVNQLMSPGFSVNVKEPSGYTPRAVRILENASREAKRYKAKLIGTEHILIGMLKETESVATRLLATLGVNIQKLYVDLMVSMGEDSNNFKDEFGKNKKKTKATTL